MRGGRGNLPPVRISFFWFIVKIEHEKRRFWNGSSEAAAGHCVLRGGHRLYREGVEEVSVSENIRRLREEKGLSQAELARMVGVSAAMICQIERGTKAPSLQLGALIAAALGCELGQLVGGEADRGGAGV